MNLSSEKVIKLKEVPQPHGGNSMAAVHADEQSLVLEYVSSDDTKVQLMFKAPTIHKFGFPNDEVLSGHPLFSKGLEHYGAYEVENSSWISELAKVNSVHNQHNKERFTQEKHHYVLTFHDSTFECIAQGVSVG